MMISIKEKRLKRDIHDDHLMNILSRLPVRSLVRFGSVSKNWLSLTRDPFFIRMHYSRTIETNPYPSFAKLALKEYYDYLESLNLTEDDKELGLNGRGGMVFISGSPANDMNFQLTNIIDVVEEFIIGRGSKSPPHTYHSALRPCCGLLGFESETHVLLVNPTTREQKHAFFDDWEEGDVSGVVTLGFDPVAMMFKLVLLVRTESGINRCDVLRLESSSSEWETVDIATRNYSDISACIDGTLYFLAFEENTVLVVRFDVILEAFDTEVLVPLQCETGIDYELHELEGCLCLTSLNCAEQSTFIDIWVLKDTTNGIWEKKHSLLVLQSPYDGSFNIKILWVSKTKVWFCGQFRHLYCYDVLARTYSRVFVWEKQPLEWVGGFVESMLSIGF